MTRTATAAHSATGTLVRINGIVQGVGFRPTVWRLARELGIRGDVINDGSGVLIRAWAKDDCIDALINALRASPPPLARIETIARDVCYGPAPDEFSINQSTAGGSHTGVAADAAVCAACVDDTLNPFSRRYRYPFTNCTHCGPRFSIVEAIPYDRAATTMRAFAQCPQCLSEYRDPPDRRFHAQPNACHACGPVATLARLDGRALCTENLTQLDDVDAACTLLQRGEIIVVKGIGGFHLACDATNEATVNALRTRKKRAAKPFALLARDLETVRRYVHVSVEEEALLTAIEAPLVLLERRADGDELASNIAHGHSTLGFMLPYTPLHHLLMRRMKRPIVLTSGNHSDTPQCIANDEALRRLAGIADYVLTHNRDIVTRVDDSVARVIAGKPRLLRRGRGYAPASLPLPRGFEDAPPLLAMGAELKNTFCLLTPGKAIVSQHMGDLGNAAVYDDYLKNLRRYGELFEHQPGIIAVDAHPDYLSSKYGAQIASDNDLPLVTVQHHHAHIAACLADNNRARDAAPVVGVALDGLGYADGQLWGGEFLLADYCHARRVGTFKPVALPGGAQAMREPWRNTVAHLLGELGWDQFAINYADLELFEYLQGKPIAALQRMIANGTNAPPASSCGRLFDAVAAAVGLCRERVSYEGQAAMELEAAVDQRTLHDEDDALAYPFAIPRLRDSGLPYVEPLAMWQALLGDLILRTPVGVISARFHKGLAKVIARMVVGVTERDGERECNDVALSGGVFQNKTLLELLVADLDERGYNVLLHQQVPANDGGLALGQAVIAAAQTIEKETH